MTVKSFEDLKEFEQSSCDYLFLYVFVCECVFILSNIVYTNSKKKMQSLVSDFYINIKNMEHSLMVSKFVSYNYFLHRCNSLCKTLNP